MSYIQAVPTFQPVLLFDFTLKMVTAHYVKTTEQLQRITAAKYRTK
jgi:hypothetical protein